QSSTESSMAQFPPLRQPALYASRPDNAPPGVRESTSPAFYPRFWSLTRRYNASSSAYSPLQKHGKWQLTCLAPGFPVAPAPLCAASPDPQYVAEYFHVLRVIARPSDARQRPARQT